MGQRPTSRLPSEGLMKRNDNIKEGQNMFFLYSKGENCSMEETLVVSEILRSLNSTVSSGKREGKDERTLNAF